MSLRHPKSRRSSEMLLPSAQWPRHAAASQARRAWLDALLGRPEADDRVLREAKVADAGDGQILSAGIYFDEATTVNRQPRPHDYSAARSEPELTVTTDVDATGGTLWNALLGDDTTHGMQRFARLIALFILLCGIAFWLLAP